MSKAVLLVNPGSPDSPSVPDVRRYLNEFLMDGRVIDVAWPLRRFIVGMILLNRPKESAHAYQAIWTKEGSPLVVTSNGSYIVPGGASFGDVYNVHVTSMPAGQYCSVANGSGTGAGRGGPGWLPCARAVTTMHSPSKGRSPVTIS